MSMLSLIIVSITDVSTLIEFSIPTEQRLVILKIRKRGTPDCYHVSVNFVEIYKEKLYDLLAEGSTDKTKIQLRIRERPETGPYVHGLTELNLDCMATCETAIDRAIKARVTAQNNVHSRSSRSHVICTITYRETINEVGWSRSFSSKLCLVDLAGSERTSQLTDSQRFDESRSINLSLSSLSTVISRLAERPASTINDAAYINNGGSSTGRLSMNTSQTTLDSARSSKQSLASWSSSCRLQSTRQRRSLPHHHIPYRNSKLTWLLSDSLGGNSRTTMIATLSPCYRQYNETLRTLRYAQQASLIVNQPHASQDEYTSYVRQLLDEIALLKSQLNTHRQPRFDNRKTGSYTPSCASSLSRRFGSEGSDMDTSCTQTPIMLSVEGCVSDGWINGDTEAQSQPFDQIKLPNWKRLTGSSGSKVDSSRRLRLGRRSTKPSGKRRLLSHRKITSKMIRLAESAPTSLPILPNDKVLNTRRSTESTASDYSTSRPETLRVSSPSVNDIHLIHSTHPSVDDVTVISTDELEPAKGDAGLLLPDALVLNEVESSATNQLTSLNTHSSEEAIACQTDTQHRSNSNIELVASEELARINPASQSTSATTTATTVRPLRRLQLPTPVQHDYVRLINQAPSNNCLLVKPKPTSSRLRPILPQRRVVNTLPHQTPDRVNYGFVETLDDLVSNRSQTAFPSSSTGIDRLVDFLSSSKECFRSDEVPIFLSESINSLIEQLILRRSQVNPQLCSRLLDLYSRLKRETSHPLCQDDYFLLIDAIQAIDKITPQTSNQIKSNLQHLSIPKSDLSPSRGQTIPHVFHPPSPSSTTTQSFSNLITLHQSLVDQMIESLTSLQNHSSSDDPMHQPCRNLIDKLKMTQSTHHTDMFEVDINDLENYFQLFDTDDASIPSIPNQDDYLSPNLTQPAEHYQYDVVLDNESGSDSNQFAQDLTNDSSCFSITRLSAQHLLDYLTSLPNDESYQLQADIREAVSILDDKLSSENCTRIELTPGIVNLIKQLLADPTLRLTNDASDQKSDYKSHTPDADLDNLLTDLKAILPSLFDHEISSSSLTKPQLACLSKCILTHESDELSQLFPSIFYQAKLIGHRPDLVDSLIGDLRKVASSDQSSPDQLKDVLETDTLHLDAPTGRLLQSFLLDQPRSTLLVDVTKPDEESILSHLSTDIEMQLDNCDTDSGVNLPRSVLPALLGLLAGESIGENSNSDSQLSPILLSAITDSSVERMNANNSTSEARVNNTSRANVINPSLSSESQLQTPSGYWMATGETSFFSTDPELSPESANNSIELSARYGNDAPEVVTEFHGKLEKSRQLGFKSSIQQHDTKPESLSDRDNGDAAQSNDKQFEDPLQNRYKSLSTSKISFFGANETNEQIIDQSPRLGQQTRISEDSQISTDYCDSGTLQVPGTNTNNKIFQIDHHVSDKISDIQRMLQGECEAKKDGDELNSNPMSDFEPAKSRNDGSSRQNTYLNESAIDSSGFDQQETLPLKRRSPQTIDNIVANKEERQSNNAYTECLRLQTCDTQNEESIPNQVFLISDDNSKANGFDVKVSVEKPRIPSLAVGETSIDEVDFSSNPQNPPDQQSAVDSRKFINVSVTDKMIRQSEEVESTPISEDNFELVHLSDEKKQTKSHLQQLRVNHQKPDNRYGKARYPAKHPSTGRVHENEYQEILHEPQKNSELSDTDLYNHGPRSHPSKHPDIENDSTNNSTNHSRRVEPNRMTKSSLPDLVLRPKVKQTTTSVAKVESKIDSESTRGRKTKKRRPVKLRSATGDRRKTLSSIPAVEISTSEIILDVRRIDSSLEQPGDLTGPSITVPIRRPTVKVSSNMNYDKASESLAVPQKPIYDKNGKMAANFINNNRGHELSINRSQSQNSRLIHDNYKGQVLDPGLVRRKDPSSIYLSIPNLDRITESYPHNTSNVSLDVPTTLQHRCKSSESQITLTGPGNEIKKVTASQPDVRGSVMLNPPKQLYIIRPFDTNKQNSNNNTVKCNKVTASCKNLSTDGIQVGNSSFNSPKTRRLHRINAKLGRLIRAYLSRKGDSHRTGHEDCSKELLSTIDVQLGRNPSVSHLILPEKQLIELCDQLKTDVPSSYSKILLNSLNDLELTKFNGTKDDTDADTVTKHNQLSELSITEPEKLCKTHENGSVTDDHLRNGPDEHRQPDRSQIAARNQPLINSPILQNEMLGPLDIEQTAIHSSSEDANVSENFQTNQNNQQHIAIDKTCQDDYASVNGNNIRSSSPKQYDEHQSTPILSIDRSELSNKSKPNRRAQGNLQNADELGAVMGNSKASNLRIKPSTCESELDEVEKKEDNFIAPRSELRDKLTGASLFDQLEYVDEVLDGKSDLPHLDAVDSCSFSETTSNPADEQLSQINNSLTKMSSNGGTTSGLTSGDQQLKGYSKSLSDKLLVNQINDPVEIKIPNISSKPVSEQWREQELKSNVIDMVDGTLMPKHQTSTITFKMTPKESVPLLIGSTPEHRAFSVEQLDERLKNNKQSNQSFRSKTPNNVEDYTLRSDLDLIHTSSPPIHSIRATRETDRLDRGGTEDSMDRYRIFDPGIEFNHDVTKGKEERMIEKPSTPTNHYVKYSEKSLRRDSNGIVGSTGRSPDKYFEESDKNQSRENLRNDHSKTIIELKSMVGHGDTIKDTDSTANDDHGMKPVDTVVRHSLKMIADDPRKVDTERVNMKSNVDSFQPSRHRAIDLLDQYCTQVETSTSDSFQPKISPKVILTYLNTLNMQQPTNTRSLLPLIHELRTASTPDLVKLQSATDWTVVREVLDTLSINQDEALVNRSSDELGNNLIDPVTSDLNRIVIEATSEKEVNKLMPGLIGRHIDHSQVTIDDFLPEWTLARNLCNQLLYEFDPSIGCERHGRSLLAILSHLLRRFIAQSRNSLVEISFDQSRVDELDKTIETWTKANNIDLTSSLPLLVYWYEKLSQVLGNRLDRSEKTSLDANLLNVLIDTERELEQGNWPVELSADQAQSINDFSNDFAVNGLVNRHMVDYPLRFRLVKTLLPLLLYHRLGEPVQTSLDDICMGHQVFYHLDRQVSNPDNQRMNSQYLDNLTCYCATEVIKRHRVTTDDRARLIEFNQDECALLANCLNRLLKGSVKLLIDTSAKVLLTLICQQCHATLSMPYPVGWSFEMCVVEEAESILEQLQVDLDQVTRLRFGNLSNDDICELRQRIDLMWLRHVIFAHHPPHLFPIISRLIELAQSEDPLVSDVARCTDRLERDKVETDYGVDDAVINALLFHLLSRKLNHLDNLSFTDLVFYVFVVRSLGHHIGLTEIDLRDAPLAEIAECLITRPCLPISNTLRVRLTMSIDALSNSNSLWLSQQKLSTETTSLIEDITNCFETTTTTQDTFNRLIEIEHECRQGGYTKESLLTILLTFIDQSCQLSSTTSQDGQMDELERLHELEECLTRINQMPESINDPQQIIGLLFDLVKIRLLLDDPDNKIHDDIDTLSRHVLLTFANPEPCLTIPSDSTRNDLITLIRKVETLKNDKITQLKTMGANLLKQHELALIDQATISLDSSQLDRLTTSIGSCLVQSYSLSFDQRRELSSIVRNARSNSELQLTTDQFESIMSLFNGRALESSSGETDLHHLDILDHPTLINCLFESFDHVIQPDQAADLCSWLDWHLSSSRDQSLLSLRGQLAYAALQNSSVNWSALVLPAGESTSINTQIKLLTESDLDQSIDQLTHQLCNLPLSEFDEDGLNVADYEAIRLIDRNLAKKVKLALCRKMESHSPDVPSTLQLISSLDQLKSDKELTPISPPTITNLIRLFQITRESINTQLTSPSHEPELAYTLAEYLILLSSSSRIDLYFNEACMLASTLHDLLGQRRFTRLEPDVVDALNHLADRLWLSAFESPEDCCFQLSQQDTEVLYQCALKLRVDITDQLSAVIAQMKDGDTPIELVLAMYRAYLIMISLQPNLLVQHQLTLLHAATALLNRSVASELKPILDALSNNIVPSLLVFNSSDRSLDKMLDNLIATALELVRSLMTSIDPDQLALDPNDALIMAVCLNIISSRSWSIVIDSSQKVHLNRLATRLFAASALHQVACIDRTSFVALTEAMSRLTAFLSHQGRSIIQTTIDKLTNYSSDSLLSGQVISNLSLGFNLFATSSIHSPCQAGRLGNSLEIITSTSDAFNDAHVRAELCQNLQHLLNKSESEDEPSFTTADLLLHCRVITAYLAINAHLLRSRTDFASCWLAVVILGTAIDRPTSILHSTSWDSEDAVPLSTNCRSTLTFIKHSLALHVAQYRDKSPTSSQFQPLTRVEIASLHELVNHWFGRLEVEAQRQLTTCIRKLAISLECDMSVDLNEDELVNAIRLLSCLPNRPIYPHEAWLVGELMIWLVKSSPGEEEEADCLTDAQREALRSILCPSRSRPRFNLESHVSILFLTSIFANMPNLTTTTSPILGFRVEPSTAMSIASAIGQLNNDQNTNNIIEICRMHLLEAGVYLQFYWLSQSTLKTVDDWANRILDNLSHQVSYQLFRMFKEIDRFNQVEFPDTSMMLTYQQQSEFAATLTSSLLLTPECAELQSLVQLIDKLNTGRPARLNYPDYQLVKRLHDRQVSKKALDTPSPEQHLTQMRYHCLQLVPASTNSVQMLHAFCLTSHLIALANNEQLTDLILLRASFAHQFLRDQQSARGLLLWNCLPNEVRNRIGLQVCNILAKLTLLTDQWLDSRLTELAQLELVIKCIEVISSTDPNTRQAKQATDCLGRLLVIDTEQITIDGDTPALVQNLFANLQTGLLNERQMIQLVAGIHYLNRHDLIPRSEFDKSQMKCLIEGLLKEDRSLHSSRLFNSIQNRQNTMTELQRPLLQRGQKVDSVFDVNTATVSPVDSSVMLIDDSQLDHLYNQSSIEPDRIQQMIKLWNNFGAKDRASDPDSVRLLQRMTDAAAREMPIFLSPSSSRLLRDLFQPLLDQKASLKRIIRLLETSSSTSDIYSPIIAFTNDQLRSAIASAQRTVDSTVQSVNVDDDMIEQIKCQLQNTEEILPDLTHRQKQVLCDLFKRTINAMPAAQVQSPSARQETNASDHSFSCSSVESRLSTTGLSIPKSRSTDTQSKTSNESTPDIDMSAFAKTLPLQLPDAKSFTSFARRFMTSRRCFSFDSPIITNLSTAPTHTEKRSVSLQTIPIEDFDAMHHRWQLLGQLIQSRLDAAQSRIESLLTCLGNGHASQELVKIRSEVVRLRRQLEFVVRQLRVSEQACNQQSRCTESLRDLVVQQRRLALQRLFKSQRMTTTSSSETSSRQLQSPLDDVARLKLATSRGVEVPTTDHSNATTSRFSSLDRLHELIEIRRAIVAGSRDELCRLTILSSIPPYHRQRPASNRSHQCHTSRLPGQKSHLPLSTPRSAISSSVGRGRSLADLRSFVDKHRQYTSQLLLESQRSSEMNSQAVANLSGSIDRLGVAMTARPSLQR